MSNYLGEITEVKPFEPATFSTLIVGTSDDVKYILPSTETPLTGTVLTSVGTKELVFSLPPPSGGGDWQSIAGSFAAPRNVNYDRIVNWGYTFLGMRPCRLSMDNLTTNITHLILNMNPYVIGTTTITFEIYKNANGNTYATITEFDNKYAQVSASFTDTNNATNTYARIDLTALNINCVRGDVISIYPKYSGVVATHEFSCFLTGTKT